MSKKIALVIAHEGYQPVEYGVPKTILTEHGYDVVTVSDKVGVATATDGTTTKVDRTLQDLDTLEYDALVFIGGSGALDHLDNDLSYEKIQQMVMADKLVAGICAAARILAKAGALVTKNATGWDGDGQLREVFEKHGVIYDDADYLTDGLTITAKGPKVAKEFAESIMKVV